MLTPLLCKTVYHRSAFNCPRFFCLFFFMLCFLILVVYSWWHFPWVWSTATWCRFKLCVLLCDWSSYQYEPGTSGRNGCNGFLDRPVVWISYPGTGTFRTLLILTLIPTHTFNIHTFMHTFTNKTVIYLVALARLDWEKEAKKVCHNLSFPLK